MKIEHWENTFKDLRDASTIATLIGAVAELAGVDAVREACSAVKQPLLASYLTYQGYREKMSLMKGSYGVGAVLIWGKVFESVTGLRLGAAFSAVSQIQGTGILVFLGYHGMRKAVAAEDRGGQVDHGALAAKYALTLLGGGLKLVECSPTAVLSVKLIEGAIGTFQVYWHLEVRPRHFPYEQRNEGTGH